MENGDHRDARPVNDLDDLALLRTLQTLRKGADLAGFDLEGAPELFAGATVTWPRDGADVAAMVARAAAKVEAGARFLVAPPVFDLARAKPLLEGLAKHGVPVLATVFLLKSAAVARYIATHEPHSGVSEELIKRIRQARDREQECIHIAAESVTALREHARGVVLQTLGWENRIPLILDAMGA